MSKFERITRRIRRVFQTNPMELRIAVREDIPHLVRIRLKFLNEKWPDADPAKEEILAVAIELYLRKHMSAGDLVFWLAVDKDRIVATGGIAFNYFPPDFDSVTEVRGQLLNLYALPDFRDEGLEQRILHKLLQEAEQRNVECITLHGSEANKDGNNSFLLKRKGKHGYIQS